jgi:hypothetical protein
VKLLCEELVVFRDKKGRVGALEPHCSHRGTSLSDIAPRFDQPLFEQLRWLGDAEGQNLTIERYSGEGRPEGYANLAR